jgi:hypothetical protein
METSASPSRVWRFVLPVAVAACLYVNYLYNAHPPEGALSNGEMSARHPTLITPAGYAFSIWGVIFSGLVAYTIWQLRPAAWRTPLPGRLTPVLTLAVLVTTCWTLVFSYGHIGLSLVVMLAILGLLAVAYARARPVVLSGAAPAWPAWFLSLFLGWIMLATVLNVIFGLRDALGVEWSAPASLAGSYGLVVVAAVLGTGLGQRGRDVLLPLPVAWGLAGTYVAQRAAHQTLALVALSAAAALATGAVLDWLRKRRPTSVTR